MKSSMITLMVIGLFVTLVQCNHGGPTMEYVIKQHPLREADSYEIEGKTDGTLKFTIQSENGPGGRKLILSQDDKQHYIARHELIHSTWNIRDAVTGRELGLIKGPSGPMDTEIEANGAFGHYRIKLDNDNHRFSITKDDQRVAEIKVTTNDTGSTCNLQVYGYADQALMVLFATAFFDDFPH